jgi:hypothetical protein
MTEDNKTMLLWEFPFTEHEAWQALTGNHDTSHTDYQDMVTQAITNFEAAGWEWGKVRMTVGQMRAELAARDLENGPGNRALVLNLIYAEREGSDE